MPEEGACCVMLSWYDMMLPLQCAVLLRWRVTLSQSNVMMMMTMMCDAERGTCRVLRLRAWGAPKSSSVKGRFMVTAPDRVSRVIGLASRISKTSTV